MKSKVFLGLVLTMAVSGCDLAREAFYPTRYTVSCMDEKNKEIAAFRCNELSISEGLVILDDCADDYRDKSVVLACPVLVVKDSAPKPKKTRVFK